MMQTSAMNSVGSFEIVDFADLNFIGFEQRRPCFESSRKTLIQPTTLTELRGLGFHAFGRKNLVNLNNYAGFDAKTGTFTFMSGARCKIADKYVSLLALLLQNYRPQPIAYPMAVLDGEDVVEIDINTVEFVDLVGRVPQYNVGHRKYRHITTVDELSTPAITALGFEHMDRGSLVNLTKIKWYDRKEGEVYFDKEGIDKPASVAYIHRKVIEARLDPSTIVDNNAVKRPIAAHTPPRSGAAYLNS